MKKQVERWIAVVLCICLWSTCLVPLHASDTLHVTFSPEIPTVMASEADQTVTVKLLLDEKQDIEFFIYHVICEDPIDLISAVHGTTEMNYESTDDDYTITGLAVNAANHLGELTFRIPGGTELGEYTIELESQNGGVLIDDATKSLSAQTVIRVVKESGYAAELSGDTTASVGDPVDMAVTVSGSPFASAAFSLAYDNTRLEFLSAGGCAFRDENGLVTVVDYGEEKSVPHTYNLSFRALSDGVADVTLEEAAFGTADSAETGDLTKAALSSRTVSVAIAKREFEVMLPEIFDGFDTVVEGEDYLFEAVDTANYNYGTVTVTMAGNSFEVSPDDNGVYVVENVTGPLVIRGQRTPKTYTITFRTDSAVNLPGDGTVTYGTAYSFDLPEEENYAISITSIKCNGSSVSYSVKDGTVTIQGANILGNIVVTLDKVRTNAAISISGNAASELKADQAVAEPGKNLSVTLTPDSRYNYQIAATVNGVEVPLQQNGNVFTIAAEYVSAGSIVFTVQKSLKTEGLETRAYLQLDGTMVWLVQYPTEKDASRVYTYDGKAMLWSEQYDAYCILIIAQTSDGITEEKLDLRMGTPVSVDYGMDVNNSGKVDMNDVQLTYNLYNNHYQNFTDNVTMEKMLRADVNGSGNVDVEDARYIVNHILGD